MQGVGGSNNGLQTDNRFGLKVRPLVTVQELLDVYLTGLNITDPTTGQRLPDATYQTFIDNGVAMLETYLDLSITEVKSYVEDRDFRLNDYAEWGFFALDNLPVIEIEKIDLTYFRDTQGQPEVAQSIPLNWIRLDPHSGIVRLIPNARFPAQLQVGAMGFFPEILRSQFVPHLWSVTYSFGFKDGCIPVLINTVISKFAAMQALVVGGNLIIGAGIASSSISLDGLSQTINTTQSAENSAFSATIKEYGAQVFGRSKGDPFAELKILKDYYKGTGMNVL